MVAPNLHANNKRDNTISQSILTYVSNGRFNHNRSDNKSIIITRHSGLAYETIHSRRLMEKLENVPSFYVLHCDITREHATLIPSLEEFTNLLIWELFLCAHQTKFHCKILANFYQVYAIHLHLSSAMERFIKFCALRDTLKHLAVQQSFDRFLRVEPKKRNACIYVFMLWVDKNKLSFKSMVW